MKMIIPNHNQNRGLVCHNKNPMFNQEKIESNYAAEATEFIDCDLRMKEQPFESPGKKLTVARFIYY